VTEAAVAGEDVAQAGVSAADQIVSASVYRPYLDGLRAIAVYLVVLFHAGLSQFSGGFVGVDVFFVLSGFLVTQLLVRDIAESGSIRFGRFYARRFRRLLPAAFVTLLVTALVFAAVSPSEALASLGSFKAAFLYYANWFFIRESTNYFAAGVASDPVLHFWSLAIEEQFYLLWPLALAAIFWCAARLRNRQVLFVRALVGAGALASLAWALFLNTSDPNRAYFGTDARAYQLLAGASIALMPDLVSSLRRFPRAMQAALVLGVAAVVALGCGVGGLDPIGRGVAVTVAAGLVIVALESAHGGPLKRLLSTEPIVYLGKISYGTYLWHWPLIVLAAEVLELSPGVLAWSACLVATALASLSFHLLERPVRMSKLLDRQRFVVIGASLAVSIVSALVVIPAIVDPGTGSSVAAGPASEGTPIPSWVDTSAIFIEGFGQAQRVTCFGVDPSKCTIVHGSGPHLLLMGDSNAEMMIPAFVKLARDNDLTLSLEVTAGCPWQRGIYRNAPDVQAECRRNREDAYDRVIDALDPDVLVLVTVAQTNDRGPLDPARGKPNAQFATATETSLDQLDVGGRKIVVMEPIPATPDLSNPLTCLDTAKWLEDCRYVPYPNPTWYETAIRKRADASDTIWAADFDRFVCPYLPICDPIIDGVVVKWDGQHLASRFSRRLATPIAAYLRANKIIP
jgi:peptidoglycan/LPS O-acetylase OafA/YrhL